MDMSRQSTSEPHFHGHRRRLRERFMESKIGTLPNYELLELLLFYAIPRIDTKPVAKRLLDRFGNLGAILAASPARLREDPMISTQAAALLRAVYDISIRMAREEIIDRPLLSSWQTLMDYLRVAMAHESKETFRVLFLNKKNKVLADEVQQQGTVDHTPVYPREVVRRALELHATALILVHNHPSGDSKPSSSDIEMTRDIHKALKAVDIVLHDHIIVGKNNCSSFKTMGLL